MFSKDFAENDIWQHFDAVKNGRVYDLTYAYFGMSATFEYPKALEELQSILYPDSEEAENSGNAAQTSETEAVSDGTAQDSETPEA